MSHEAHHDTHHHTEEAKPTTSFRSSVWFVIILAGLFVASVNFVNVMGHDEGEGHGGHGTEHSQEHRIEPVTTHQPGEAPNAATEKVDNNEAHERETKADADSEHPGQH